MTATKKSIRFLTVLALVFAMVFSITSIPASAIIDGPETWYKGSSMSNYFTVYGTNTTNRKTMGDSGVLTITLTYKANDVGGLEKVKGVVEIRNANNQTIASNESYAVFTQGAVSVSTNVSKGQEVFIYMATYDSSGNKVTSTVNYLYRLS